MVTYKYSENIQKTFSDVPDFKIFYLQDDFGKFMLQVTRLYPQYEYTVTRGDRVRDVDEPDAPPKLRIARIHVSHRGVRLGTVDCGYYRRRYAICVNPEHDSSSTTADVAKALALFKKHFKPVSDHHVVCEAFTKLQAYADLTSSRYTYALENAKREAMVIAYKFMMKNLKTVAGEYPNNAKVLNLVAANQDFEDNMFKVALPEQLKAGNLHAVVECENGTWFTDRMVEGILGTKRVEYASWDDLPEGVRLKVGVLRMLDGENAIEGIGIRLDERTFAVFVDA